jgi:hypothetical protein
MKHNKRIKHINVLYISYTNTKLKIIQLENQKDNFCQI